MITVWEAKTALTAVFASQTVIMNGFDLVALLIEIISSRRATLQAPHIDLVSSLD